MWFEIIAVAVLGYLIYVLLLSRASPPAYWKEHGIRQIDSSVVASNIDILLGRRSIMDRDVYAYQLMGSDKFCGMMETPSPVILVKDLELVKKIMIKDFDHFVNRRDFFTIGEKNILAKTVAILKGEAWKGVRSSMSPTFTTGKIRRMMEHFNNVSQEWIGMLRKKCDSNNASIEIDVTKTVTEYTIEVIATAVFGMRAGAIGNPDALFYQMAQRLSELGFIDALKFNISPRYPKLLPALGIEVLDQKAITFYESLVRQSLEARLNGSIERNDFQQLMIETQKGHLKAVGSDELDTYEKDAQLKEVHKGSYLTNDVIVANSLLFFIAGSQTVTAVVTFALYVLAAHPDIQEKLRKEIDGIIKEDGSLDYDELGKLTYLDKFTDELLRKYPPAFRLEREAVNDYHDRESGLFVPKGATVAVPLHSIHHDPKYFPNPDRFDPENFSPERKASRHPYAYMPFGIGPRNCIGMRFGLVESKAVVAKTVRNFIIEPTAKTPLPVCEVAAGLQSFPPKNLELKLTARQIK